ncbi:hypothetical protein, partial [Klebsiella pneumoniae]|uniref:hypothetical protein n=1 Tax=Klebsiella pneumoniae TaxID=573 RepID=UPI00272FAD93
EGQLEIDSFALAPPSFALIDPETEPWYQQAARLLDRGVDFIVRAPSVERYSDTAETPAGTWPEIAAARRSGQTEVYLRYAP